MKSQLKGIKPFCFPVSARRRFIHGSKARRKCLLAFKSCRKCDFQNGLVGKNEQLGRLRQSPPLYIIMDGKPYGIGKHTMEMIFGVVYRLRYPVQIQFFGEMIFHIVNNCRNIFNIAVCHRYFLLQKSYYTQLRGIAFNQSCGFPTFTHKKSGSYKVRPIKP